MYYEALLHVQILWQYAYYTLLLSELHGVACLVSNGIFCRYGKRFTYVITEFPESHTCVVDLPTSVGLQTFYVHLTELLRDM